MSHRAHVLVCRLDNVGDVLLTGPAVRAVASRARRVTFLCSTSGAAAAELLPGVDSIIPFDAAWVAYDPPPVSWPSVMELVAHVQEAAVEQAIIFTSFHQSPLPLALLLRLAGVEDIAAICDDYPGALLDVRHRIDQPMHEVERALSLAAAAGYGLDPTDDASLRLRDLPEHVGLERPYVVVHPRASVPARGWRSDRAREVVEALTTAGWRVVVTGSADDRSRSRLFPADPRPGVTDLRGQTTLAELAGILRGAAALVTGNTGPAHLAAAVGTPVVSLFAPVVPFDQWRPWGVPVEVLGDQTIECAGCRARVCPLPGQPCTADVTAGDVVRAVSQLAPTVARR